MTRPLAGLLFQHHLSLTPLVTTPLNYTCLQVLGVDLTNDMLSSLFVIRCDTAITVRQVSLTVWKTMVSNSGKTIVEILPWLIRLMVGRISSNNMDMRIIASRALGEVVKKQGDRVLPVIIPYLKEGLANEDSSQSFKQGIDASPVVLNGYVM